MTALGRQRPTFWTGPPEAYTEGPQARALAEAYFAPALDWQAWLLDRLLARGPGGRLASHSAGLWVPRQNGKSWVVRAWCFYAMCVLGYRVLYTCQNGDTADEMFRSLADVFEDEGNADVHPLLVGALHGNGQQRIQLANGGMARFTTRTDSLARGRSYDAVVYDEAQELTPGQQAATLPTLAASPSGDTMTLYLGTPPVPGRDGGVFRRMREEARAGRAAGLWAEWGVDEAGDKRDRARWREANPSLGALISEEAVEGELAMSDEDFARERLGWCPPGASAAAAIGRELWEAAAIPQIGGLYRRRRALAVRFSPDGARYAVAGAKADAKGGAAFELVELGTTGRGTAGLARAVWERRGSCCCCVVDGASGADALCARLADMGCPRGYVVRPRAADASAAATGLLDGLRSGALKHASQPALDESALRSVPRPVGAGGGWAFGTDGECDPEPVQACALAVWGLRASRRDPGRRQMML